MRIAVLTFDGFNEIDSFVALAMLNRVKSLQALIVCPVQQVASMNGVVVQSQAPLSFARDADAVIEVAAATSTPGAGFSLDGELELTDDDRAQRLALVFASRGLRMSLACTDSTTKPWVEEAGIRVLDEPFVAHGNVATAGVALPPAISRR